MDCVDSIEDLWWIVVAIWVFAGRIIRFMKRMQGGQGESAQPSTSNVFIDDEYGEDEYGDAALGITPEAEAEPERITTAPAVVEEDPFSEIREELRGRVKALLKRARDQHSKMVHERPNRRFLDVPKVYVPGLLEKARQRLLDSSVGNPEHPEVIINSLEQVDGLLRESDFILDIIDGLAQQRRHPELAPMLGDADQLAEACYQPILTFAKAEGLPITSNHPAVAFSRFDLQIWTGLIPTSVAPIFLPPDFFDRASWWPALAHETAHDFYNSIEGFDAALRRDLDLPSSEAGAQILRAPNQGLELNEIQGVFGAWLEEIFCDVFGTMMTGPAYLASMLDLFSAEHDPTLVNSVAMTRDGHGGYAPHPPRHLRVLITASLLGELGLHEDALKLRAEWHDRHKIDGAEIDFLIVPTQGGRVGIAVEPFEQFGRKLAQRLYRGPLHALKGRGLRAISGLDYGTHRHQETLRARQAFLAGQLPTARDPRPVIAGAVLAARAQPQDEGAILHLARKAIPALGTAEKWGQRRRPISATGNPLAEPLEVEDLVGGLIVHELFKPSAERARGNR